MITTAINPKSKLSLPNPLNENQMPLVKVEKPGLFFYDSIGQNYALNLTIYINYQTPATGLYTN